MVIEERTGTRVVALEADEMDRFVGPAFDAEKDARLTLLFYELSIAELDLPRGELTMRSEPPSRPLPEPDDLFEATVEHGGFEWSHLDGLPDRLRGIRVAATPRDDCLAGGCYLDADRARALWCTRPCPVSVSIDPVAGVVVPMEPGPLWSPPPRRACGGATVQWVDATDCAPIDVCPAGRFNERVPPGAIYVDPDAAAGGDGSEAAPFRTIAEAAQRGPAIALSKGTHTGTVSAQDLVLVGACAAETKIDAVAATDGSVFIESLALKAATVSHGTLDLFRVLVEGTGPQLVIGDSAVIRGREVVLRNPSGLAFAAGPGSTIELERSVVQAARGAIDTVGARVMLSDTAVVGSESNGAVVRDGEVELERTLFEGNGRLGLEASNVVLAISDVVVRDGGIELGGGMALFSSIGAVARVLVERTHLRGIEIFGGRIDLWDFVVRDMLPIDSVITTAPALRAYDSDLTLERARIERTPGRAIDLNGGTIRISDLVIDGVMAAEQEGNKSFGLIAFEAELIGERIEVGNFDTTGIYLERGTSDLSDVVVHHSANGNGIGVKDVSRFSLERAALEEHRRAGIQVGGRSDALLRNVRSSYAAVGADLGDGSRVELDRVFVSDTRSLGICMRDQARITAADVEIERVRAETSIECTITTPPGGTGLILNGQPLVELHRFRIANSDAIGILINRDASTNISDGEIRGNYVGAQLDPEVDPSAIMVRVLYADNVTNVEVY